jgi:hypothetical protein
VGVFVDDHLMITSVPLALAGATGGCRLLLNVQDSGGMLTGLLAAPATCVSSLCLPAAT